MVKHFTHLGMLRVPPGFKAVLDELIEARRHTQHATVISIYMQFPGYLQISTHYFHLVYLDPVLLRVPVLV
jgi:hypothetical protein